MSCHMLGVSAAKALGTINVLLGNLDVPGGIQGTYNASWRGFNSDEDGLIDPNGLMTRQVTGEDGLVYPPVMVDMAGY